MTGVIGLHKHLPAYAQAFTTDQGFPCQRIAAAEQEKFHFAARFFPGKDARRDDARLIQNQQIPCLEIGLDVSEGLMFQFPGLTMQHKQTRRIARLDGSLRDGRFGEMVVEVGGFQDLFLQKTGNDIE